jgi:hypothetical protein
MRRPTIAWRIAAAPTGTRRVQQAQDRATRRRFLPGRRPAWRLRFLATRRAAAEPPGWQSQPQWESGRLGHITKQGSSVLRFLLVEAAQVTVRSLPEWRSKYFHLMMRRGGEDRQGCDGATRDSFVLDLAQGMGLRASEKVRFARGHARNRPWCAVEHRVIDWAARSSFTEEFEEVIMIEVATEEMHGSN